MHKAIWLATFLFGAPAIIVWSIFLLLYTTKKPPTTILSSSQVLGASNEVFSAADDTLTKISGEVSTADARSLILKRYLEERNSDLATHSDLLVKTADKYDIDFRLLVAIARQESNLCKIIPINSYNCWGFGIYGDKVTRFESYEQGIEIVSKTLKIHYIDKGLKTPEEIMRKYTPPSVAIGGPWAKGVNQFLSELE